jgi:AraC family transcriptional regulator
MEPRIVSRPAFTVAGLAYRGTPDGEKIGALWGQFGPRMCEMQPVIEPDVAYGVMANYDEATGEFDYTAACQVPNGAALPQGFVAVDIPAGDWAVFTTTMQEMSQTYPYIYGSWLPQSGYQHGPAPEFELYGPAFEPSNPDSELEIYIPVVKGK